MYQNLSLKVQAAGLRSLLQVQGELTGTGVPTPPVKHLVK